MSRIRISTTVDEHLLRHAREIGAHSTDASLLDEALRAFLAQHRRAEIDASYSVYERHPLDEPDEWGDIVSFLDAAGRA